MPQDKNERLVLRITPGLKKSIEDLARKQNITSSELVRKILEDVVCEKERAIEQCVLMVNSISKHTDSLLEQMLFAIMPKDIASLTEEIRHYRKLSYNHQIKAIELMTEERVFEDNKAITLQKAYENDLEALNTFLGNKESDLRTDKGLEILQERTTMLEDKMYKSASKYYQHLVTQYYGS